ncbi:MAG: M48 family metallopeptidase [Arcobacteraceae bacterium]|nr:M48 family metallopeptidase [Arcobacteraceae bacterium]
MNITIHKKKIKNSYIRILPTCEVRISVPKYVTQNYINTLIEERREWIEQKLDFISKKMPQKISTLDSGEELLYLGQKYTLEVIADKKNFVLFDKNIQLFIKSDDFELKKKIIDKFYLEESKKLLYNLVNKYQKIVNQNVNYVRIRKMSSRWGSCNCTRKNINLNSELIKKPIEFVEYVVLHELAHLSHPNHSKDFYEYITKFMPDWKQRCKL